MDAGGGLDDDPALDALRDVLAALGATIPRLVFQKTLNRSDVDPNQLRLHMPCRPGQEINGGIAGFLTADEKDIVHDDLRGMQVPAYDRHGRRFDMSLKMLRCNRSYSLFGPQWWRFVAENQLAEAMAAANEMGRKLEVEVWAFRSAELQQLERRVETGHHPGGDLGMAILIRN